MTGVALAPVSVGVDYSHERDETVMFVRGAKAVLVAAAAEELLDIAKMCLKAEEERRKKLKTGAPATTYTEARIAKLRAAIARATGTT